VVVHQFDCLHRIWRLVWSQADEWFSVNGGSNVESNLCADVHGQRRQRVAGRHCYNDCARPCSDLLRQPQHRQEWRHLHAHLVLDQCHGLHRVGRMERHRSYERLPNDRGTDDDDPVHTDLHRGRRLCVSIRDGHRLRACFPERFPEREPDKCDKRRRFDLDLVLEQCHLVHSFGGLERQRAVERHTEHGRAFIKRDLHAHLHRTGRHGHSVGYGKCQLEHPATSRFILYGYKRSADAESERGTRYGDFTVVGVL